MAWLLDTNAWIDYLRSATSAVRERLLERKPEEIFTCSIVRAELLHGALKYGVPQRRLTIVRETLAPYRSLPFDDTAAERYATVRHELERRGEGIGPHDLLIEATCLAYNAALVTANTPEFRRIPELKVLNWQSGER
jgi:tRNA(fMet)-specific endonuclease VapC